MRMSIDWLGPESIGDLRTVLGYLNYSSGTPDPEFLRSLNRLYGHVADQTHEPPRGTMLLELLQSGADKVRGTSEAFASTEQAEAVIRLVFEDVLPGYSKFHAQLLPHQTDEDLCQPFFLGRAFEAVLSEGEPWDDTQRIERGAIRRLNDYVGYRPVATLENAPKHEPYLHERVRPIPLYVGNVGVACGKYAELIQGALDVLNETPTYLLRNACFDPDKLDELALDPRACDFDHPVNRRPNYHFGTWDPDTLDDASYYRRFVLQGVTLDGLLDRVERSEPSQRERRLFEASAVLAGTMLMGSGVSGDRPDAHDSEMSLGTLMPVIAEYRDRFYEDLLTRAPVAWRIRLQEEAEQLHQPFGGVRLDLNQYLATQRADQLIRVHLARLFALIGYPDAAHQQAEAVAVVSARIRCAIDCRITLAHQAIDRGDLGASADYLPEIEDLLHEGIDCGAFVDPWNILGFGAQFSLFPAIENTVQDHRVDDLIDLLNDIFNLYARLEKEAAAAGDGQLQAKLSDHLSKLAEWWDQFASTEVSGIEGFSGESAWESTMLVASALRAWYEAGTAAGDIRFWSQHVERFQTPKAYALVVDALLEQRDPVASMALLMRWLSEAEQVPLSEGSYSFHALAIGWMHDLWELAGEEAELAPIRPTLRRKHGPSVDPEQRWPLTRKFLDFFEANADIYWGVPSLEIEGAEAEEPPEPPEKRPTGTDELFTAAYENFTYRDSTDDGTDSELGENRSGPQFNEDEDFELALESDRLSDRLAFHVTLAKLWKFGAMHGGNSAEVYEARRQWLAQALSNWEQLLHLLEEVDRYRVPTPRGTTEALLEYDRRRGMKEVLLDRIIWTCVEIADAVQLLQANLDDPASLCELADWEEPVATIFHAIFREDRATIQETWPRLLAALAEEPLLYVPTSRGGDPLRIVASRCLQQIIARLLEYVPRLGLLTETFLLLETIHRMEQDHPVGAGAITEFDRLFEIGLKGIVEAFVFSSEDWKVHDAPGESVDRRRDLALVECVEQAIEELLRCWLGHSRGIRISVLESLADSAAWEGVKAFIERYGADLFTQQFMNFGNIRAVLHEGVDVFLESLRELSAPEIGERLMEDIEDGLIELHEATAWLEWILEAVAENYSEFIDYNSTTTQSDRGDQLFTFLEFLRVQAGYDRVAWNLKPVYWAHEVMSRCRRAGAASLWETAVVRRSSEVADGHLKRYDQLSKRYGMWLPCVHERLKERFVRPLQIDRMCAWVRRAIDESGGEEPFTAFEHLNASIEDFLEVPSCVGFELPSWLESLQDEVFDVRNRPTESQEPFDPTPAIKRVKVSQSEAYRQIRQW